MLKIDTSVLDLEKIFQASEPAELYDFLQSAIELVTELTIENRNYAYLDDAVHPALRILGRFLNIFHAIMTRASAVGFHLLSSFPHQLLLFLV